MPEQSDRSQAKAMDAMYRYQRHVYDLTRAYYLLGRDRMIRDLRVPDGGTVLEIGCGTGRNLMAVAKRYPTAKLHGIDISDEMLKSARTKIAKSNVATPIALVQGDALQFDPAALFGVAQFERIYFSYTLSMIPEWEDAVRHAASLLNPDGQMFIVDFGQGQRLPGWFARALKGWLKQFGVVPRPELEAACAPMALRVGQSWDSRQIYGGYAVLASVAPRRSRMAIADTSSSSAAEPDGLREVMPLLGVF